MTEFQIPQPIQNLVELQNFLALQRLSYTEQRSYDLQRQQVSEFHAAQEDDEYAAQAQYLAATREERVRMEMKPKARPINRW